MGDEINIIRAAIRGLFIFAVVCLVILILAYITNPPSKQAAPTSPQAPTGCSSQLALHCYSPIMPLTGQIIFNFVQNTGNTIYNVSLGCAATTNAFESEGYNLSLSFAPNTPILPLNSISGAPANNSVENNKLVYINGLQCYTFNGITLDSRYGTYDGYGTFVPMNMEFNGSVFIHYVTNSTSANVQYGIIHFTVKAV